MTRSRDHLSLRKSLHALWNCGGGTEGTRIIIEGLGWHLSRPASTAIARHVMALFLHAAKTPHSKSSRSEASDLLRSIGRRIEASVPDYGLFIYSVHVRVGLAWIAVGGRSIRSCNGKARDHCSRRVSVGDGGALIQR